MKTLRGYVFAISICLLGISLLPAQNGPYGSGAADVRAIIFKGANIFAGTYGGVFISTDNAGTGWYARNTGLTDTCVNALIVSGTSLLAGTANGGVFYSTDDGTSWTASGQTDSHVWCFAARGTQLFVGTDGGVYHSSDEGRHWTFSGLPGQRVNSLAILDTIIFAGLDSGAVYRSADGGTNWNAAGLANVRINVVATVDSILFGPNFAVDSIVFAGTSAGVFRSSNFGGSWTTVNFGLTDTCILALTSSIYGGLFAGTSHGGCMVRWSADTSSAWQTFFDRRLPPTPIRAIAYRSYTTYSYEPSGTMEWWFGTSGNGVWRDILVSVARISAQPPSHVTLNANFPNPFNPSTIISFELARSGIVRLRIFDYLGRKVATLMQEAASAGHHTVQFDGTHFSTGVYFYELEFGGLSLVHRMLLLR